MCEVRFWRGCKIFSTLGSSIFVGTGGEDTLPETNNMFAPENRPKIPKKEAGSSSNRPFSGAFTVGFGYFFSNQLGAGVRNGWPPQKETNLNQPQ